MRLGELLLKSTGKQAEEGQIKGVCMICSRETDKGYKVKDVLSDNFTGWSMFFSGNCICPECAYIFSDQTFRRKSWVASMGNFRTFKNDEAVEILFSPPEPPFFIHIAKQGQKQTWLTCLHKVAHNSEKYFFSHESYDVPILFERQKAEEYIKQAKEALQKGITKTELLNCEFKMNTWKKAYTEGYYDFLKALGKLKGDLLWGVMVDVART